MRRRHFLGLAALPLAGSTSAPPYRERVRTFADTLLEVGLDVYGPKRTPAWAGVIDTRGWSVPAQGVPDPPGMRPQDRAVGGANLYHDAITLRVFLALSELTGDARYARAARDYIAWFLRECASPENGLLAWGEHLYYDFRRDAVVLERRHHELLEWTPPWDLLWDVNREAVSKAIDGIRYHHYEDRPGALFNRHATFVKKSFQPAGGQPWIKHTGLYAYSFAFLYQKTHEKLWLDWARGDAALYWDRRNPETNLTLSCIDDPREGSKNASVGMTLLAYWLRKAALAVPEETAFRERALAYLHAWDRYSWQEDREGYLGGLTPAGKPLGSGLMPPWNFVYGESSLLPYGRVAAYVAKLDRDTVMQRAANRVADIARDTPIPDNASVEGLGYALNLAMDLWEIDRSSTRLTEARRYAGIACERFWHADGKRGIFVRLAGDRYYESKAGVGDLLAGLLRLEAAGAGRVLPGDWSF